MSMRLTVNLPFKPQSIGYEVPINIGFFFSSFVITVLADINSFTSLLHQQIIVLTFFANICIIG